MKRKVLQIAIVLLSMTAFSAAALAAEILITPFGQSPDAMMVRVVLKKQKINAKVEKLLQADQLGDAKALLMVVGGSSKGLGAAGVDKDQEIARAKALFAAAKEKGVKVLVMHIGGKGRRGKLSDMFISEAVPHADGLVVVDGGDHDGIFTNLMKGTEIKMLPAKSVRATGEPVKTFLTEWGIIK